MEVGKLRQALDQILRRCKAAGHRLHVFDPSDISHEEVVGRGEEGIVQLCKVNFHGLEEAAAIKTITTNGGKEMLDFLLQELELVVMGSDSLANAVLKVFGVVLVPVNLKTRSHHSAMCHLGIVMERGLCNLFQLLVREELDLFLRIDLMRQLARALHHLHTGDPHIIHRDVKPQNVVVTEAERSERTGLLKVVKVKLIDLGMACAVRHLEEKVSCVVGTEGYHAPEMWEEQPYTHKVDIFSLGITFLVVLLKQESLSRIGPLLESLHEMKTEGGLGQRLFAVVEKEVIEDVADIPDLKKLIVAMIAGVASRLSDAGYIYNELSRISSEATPTSRLALAQTPVISIKSSSRFPRRSMVAKLCNGGSSGADGSSPVMKSTSNASKGTGSGVMVSAGTSTASTGELVDCRSKDSDYSSLNSEPGGSKRSNTPITPSSSASTRSNSLDNWQMPKYRNFYTQTPNSDKFKDMDAVASSEIVSGCKGKRGGNGPMSKNTSTTTTTKSEERIDVLEKRLEKKEDALSLKDQLLLDKDKKLTEQRKSLQKLEIQNKELRQQLALSNAKHTPLMGRFNPITKQIRPRFLFPDDDVDVKSEPVVMGTLSSHPVGVFDGEDTSSLPVLATQEKLARSDVSAEMLSLAVGSSKSNQIWAMADSNQGDRGMPIDKIKIERRNLLPEISNAGSSVSDVCKPSPPQVSNRSDSHSLGPTRSRKRKIRLESPVPIVETPAAPTRKSGRVSAIAKRSQQLAERVEKSIVKKDSEDGENLGINGKVDDDVDPVPSTSNEGVSHPVFNTSTVEIKEEPMETIDSTLVPVDSLDILPPPKKRKKRSRSPVSASDSVSTEAITLESIVTLAGVVESSSSSATTFTDSTTHVPAELPRASESSSSLSSTSSLSLASSSSTSLSASTSTLSASSKTLSDQTSSSPISDSANSRRSVRQSLRRSIPTKKERVAKESRVSRQSLGAVDSVSNDLATTQDLLSKGFLINESAVPLEVVLVEADQGRKDVAPTTPSVFIAPQDEVTAEKLDDNPKVKFTLIFQANEDFDSVKDRSSLVQPQLQDPTSQPTLNTPSLPAETNGDVTNVSTIVDSIEAGALNLPSFPIPPLPDSKSAESPTMIVCDKNDDSTIFACASTTQLEDEDLSEESVLAAPITPKLDVNKDFIKIFGSKTYTGRKVNKSPYFSPTRTGSHSVSTQSTNGNKMPLLTTPPIVLSPVSAGRALFPSSSSEPSFVNNPRVISPVNSQLVNLVTLRPDSPLTSSSPTRHKPQPSEYPNKDVPDLNWVVGTAGQHKNDLFRSIQSDSKSKTASVPNNQPVPSMQALTPSPISSPVSFRATTSTLKPLMNAQSTLMKSPSRYHFVPSTRPVTLSPNRQSVIMRHVASPEKTPRMSDDGNSPSTLEPANLQSPNLPANLVCHSGLPTVMSIIPPSSLSNLRFVSLNAVIPNHSLPQPLPPASPTVVSVADFHPSVSSSHPIAHRLVSSLSSHSSPSSLNIIPSSPSSSASWINSEFFTLPLAESNRLNGERLMKSALASPRPSLRNGQI